jgi:alkylation response protein AidB-like acyl-CoA dehydrogenase
MTMPSKVTSDELTALRGEVRDFLAAEIGAGTFVPSCDPQVGGFSAEFSRRVGKKGWIGMTWPRRYCGQERSRLERYVVCEELLAGGAPVGAHWSADRQIGPGLLRFGTQAQRQRFLPVITRGECFFALGISEPEAGSDLASVRTRAVPSGDGWRLSGHKIWTSHAHEADYIMVLCRTSPPGDDRHAGLSQLIVPLDAPGVVARPIRTMAGKDTFGEVTFDDVEVPADMVFGTIGNGWAQVTSELADERNGPERFLSTFQLLQQMVRIAEDTDDPALIAGIGRLTARLATLRHMSYQIACFPDQPTAATDAVLVKDLGTVLEGEITRVARDVTPRSATTTEQRRFEELLAQAVLAGPSFTIRGGATEILRGIIARRLGVR